MLWWNFYQLLYLRFLLGSESVGDDTRSCNTTMIALLQRNNNDIVPCRVVQCRFIVFMSVNIVYYECAWNIQLWFISPQYNHLHVSLCQLVYDTQKRSCIKWYVIYQVYTNILHIGGNRYSIYFVICIQFCFTFAMSPLLNGSVWVINPFSAKLQHWHWYNKNIGLSVSNLKGYGQILHVPKYAQKRVYIVR